MARKTWVLDTETKGTGANVVPLEKIQSTPAPRPEPVFVLRKPPVTAPDEPEPRPSHRFKVVDLVSRNVLAEDIDARRTVEVLGEVRSIVDVNVYVWQAEREAWRLLPLEDKRALWGYRVRP